MKLIITIICCLLLTATVSAGELNSKFSYTITAADSTTGTEISETDTSNVWQMPSKHSFTRYWLTSRVVDIDTAFTLDTFKLTFQHGLTKFGPWSTYTSQTIIPASASDTTVALSASVKGDSAFTYRNWRMIAYHAFGEDGNYADIVGNTYKWEVEFYLTGQY